ncbi:hypothetical protein [Micromonospora sp. NPDC051141]
MLEPSIHLDGGCGVGGAGKALPFAGHALVACLVAVVLPVRRDLT